jgi:hypothetical protein
VFFADEVYHVESFGLGFSHWRDSGSEWVKFRAGDFLTGKAEKRSLYRLKEEDRTCGPVIRWFVPLFGKLVNK